MSDVSSGRGKNNRVLPPWRVTLGEETLFTEAARVEIAAKWCLPL
jgi:hypothetical protein